jgi:hypothetical protein
MVNPLRTLQRERPKEVASRYLRVLLLKVHFRLKDAGKYYPTTLRTTFPDDIPPNYADDGDLELQRDMVAMIEQVLGTGRRLSRSLCAG